MVPIDWFFYRKREQATTKTNAGVLRYAQNDNVKTNNGNSNKDYENNF
jgi:hypothetical protein